LYEGFIDRYCTKQIYGRMIRPNGSYYIGEWADGKQHGVGYANDEGGGQRKGRWQNGQHMEWLQQ